MQYRVGYTDPTRTEAEVDYRDPDEVWIHLGDHSHVEATDMTLEIARSEVLELFEGFNQDIVDPAFLPYELPWLSQDLYDILMIRIHDLDGIDPNTIQEAVNQAVRHFTGK